MKKPTRIIVLVIAVIMVISVASTAFAVDWSYFPQKGQADVGTSYASVKEIQHFMNKNMGNSLSCDGKFGSATGNAVKNFQRNVGLSADGVCGRNTWSKISARVKYSTRLPVSQVDVYSETNRGFQVAFDDYWNKQGWFYYNIYNPVGAQSDWIMYKR